MQTFCFVLFSVNVLYFGLSFFNILRFYDFLIILVAFTRHAYHPRSLPISMCVFQFYFQYQGQTISTSWHFSGLFGVCEFIANQHLVGLYTCELFAQMSNTLKYFIVHNNHVTLIR